MVVRLRRENRMSEAAESSSPLLIAQQQALLTAKQRGLLTAKQRALLTALTPGYIGKMPMPLLTRNHPTKQQALLTVQQRAPLTFSLSHFLTFSHLLPCRKRKI